MMPPDAPDLEHEGLFPGGEPGHARAERARRRRRRVVIVSFFLVVIVLVGAVGGWALWAMRGSDGGETVRVTIPKGATAGDISAILSDAGVLRVPWLFRVVVRWRGVAGDFKPGEYPFRMGSSYAAVIDALKIGPPLNVKRVTVPEGRTLQETARIVQRRLGIPEAAFLEAARRHRPPVRAARGASLEGFLFPKTYDFKPDVSADEVIERMLAQFDKETEGLAVARAPRNLSPFQVITVASLIEREAKVPEDRALISAVIYNRLRRGMRLEIDATVQYAIFLRTGSYKFPLTFRDYEIASPYNTYRIAGLPPGPIASPGLASIRAALDPADVDYLYYVVIDAKTGRHAFARTFEEFQRLKRRAAQARAS